MKFHFLVLVASIGFHIASAEDLTLLEEGETAFQIILPDKSTTPDIGESLAQTARLLQTAFVANGATAKGVPIRPESERDSKRPAIFLGDTAFSRTHGVDVSTLKGWGYVHQVADDRDLILAGHDHPAPAISDNPRRPSWDRIGTAKAVTNFLHDHFGVRFLYPDMSFYRSIKTGSSIDYLTSPAIEFLPMPKVSVPVDLNVKHTPAIGFNTAHPQGGGFYDIANNRFPRVDEKFGGHTWGRAIPQEKYSKSNPEYFSLINGKRLIDSKNGQYCISNSEVQELIYKDLCRFLDDGYRSVDLGQPDGFRACQCEPCKALYDTGEDWGEKIWILNRKLAERLLKDYPDRKVTMMSYILTAMPPKSFTKFPANANIMLTGTNEEDIEPWRSYEVPGGFTGYIYNWCQNLTTRYTPMRTPKYVETQARRITHNHIRSIYRDGAGALYGLEGPVYYTMDRIYDDPENRSAEELVPEFVDAAFGPSGAAHYMKQFYEQLYHAITPYSDYFATRTQAWTYQPTSGRRRKTIQDPFRMLGFLYSPPLLADMESQLSQAEGKARRDKVKARLALVRREFDYVKHLARVVHLYQAYEIQPDLASRDRLLDAIDARNAELATYWNEKGRTIPVTDDWDFATFPPGGHDFMHLRLAHNNYQGPFENTCFNWDTEEMRAAPLPGAKQMLVRLIENGGKPEWKSAEEQTLTSLLGETDLNSSVHVQADETTLYVRIECKASDDLDTVEVLLSPTPGTDIAYRFRVGQGLDSKQEEAAGFVADVMDPRHGQFDPDWNGEWKSEAKMDTADDRWTVVFSIPFKSIGLKEAPEEGAFWRANIGHTSNSARFSWSSAAGMKRLEDRNAFGEWIFGEAEPDKP